MVETFNSPLFGRKDLKFRRKVESINSVWQSPFLEFEITGSEKTLHGRNIFGDRTIGELDRKKRETVQEKAGRAQNGEVGPHQRKGF